MKQKKKAGLTMVELLCALAVLLLVAACMVVGVSLAVRSYDRSLASSEAQVLCATLQTTVSDELRYSGTLFYDQTGRLTGFFSQEHGGEDAKDGFQTDENGEINVELRVGEYTVAEAAGEDAEKYILPDDQTVGIKAGETTTVKMHNKLVPEVPTVPQTGDNPWMPAILGTLAGLAVLSGGALLFLRYTGKKRKSADQVDEDQGT